MNHCISESNSLRLLSSGREKSNMRISSKVVVPPPCQKKSQAMTRPLSSGTRHVRPETGLAGSRDSEFFHARVGRKGATTFFRNDWLSGANRASVLRYA